MKVCLSFLRGRSWLVLLVVQAILFSASCRSQPGVTATSLLELWIPGSPLEVRGLAWESEPGGPLREYQSLSGAWSVKLWLGTGHAGTLEAKGPILRQVNGKIKSISFSSPAKLENICATKSEIRAIFSALGCQLDNRTEVKLREFNPPEPRRNEGDVPGDWGVSEVFITKLDSSIEVSVRVRSDLIDYRWLVAATVEILDR